jgi:hypothetical protein
MKNSRHRVAKTARHGDILGRPPHTQLDTQGSTGQWG